MACVSNETTQQGTEHMYTQAQLAAALANRAKPDMTPAQLAAHEADLAAYNAHVAKRGVLCEVTGQYVTPEQANANLAAWDKSRNTKGA